MIEVDRACNVCKETKPATAFDFSYSTHRNTRRKVCKPCRYKQHKVYPSRHGFGLRKSNLRVKYNMTPQDYEWMFERQGGVCKICQLANNNPRWGGMLAVDHCHATGKVRGLLCDKCNRALGQLDDSIPKLESAIAYLKATA